MEPTITLAEAKAAVSQLTHPRVTEESIKEKIAAIKYIEDGITTICLVTMGNGFKFVGLSSPADERNFVREVGERYAYENAVKQIWSHEGYLLREKLAMEGQ